jgi:F0F1-type ATP synthase membrane subunit c/vacuolar-type H+-ATPase subunit K
MTVYGSRDRNPFNVPKEYEINGVKTPSNIGNVRYYTLVDSSTGEITIKTPTISGAVGGSGLDRTIGTIPKDGVFKPVVGSTTSEETKYFNSAVGQKGVKNHGVITAQKAGAQNAQQLIFPNSATPGAGQGQNAPIPGVAPGAPGANQGSTVAAGPAESGKAAGGTKTGPNSFGDFVYPEGIRNSKQDVIKFTMLEYKPSGTGATQSAGQSDRKTKNGIPVGRIILGSVVLPIPNNISDTNSMDWGSNSMNAIEAALAAAAFTGISGGIGEGIQSFGKSMEAFLKDDTSKKAFGATFAGAAASVEGNAILSRAEGAVINPNLELLFNGPQLRPFNFTFKLAAREKRESEQIINILNFFKRGSSAIKTESNLFLKAPHTFSIQYLHMGQDGEDHPFIGRIKECALQSITTSYTPEGQYATFNDGVMVSYSITMQFQELEPIFNSDYKGLTGIGY